ncbi:MAG: hypothetical protein PSV22_15985 [Pseudolabrys sp.]|nr:hypothetical protein [Pseudolabrys sp.]
MASTGRAINRLAFGLCVGGLVFSLTGPAAAQTATSVSLVQQDFSDCTNANVKDNGGGAPGGTVNILRNGDGTTSPKIGMSAVPSTTYHFFLKCVRVLGDITTDEDGIGQASFTLPAGAVGPVLAFDSYPEGAPAGNKFQSVQVHLP